MTIEEKAKAYDEGLKTVKAILNTMTDSYVCIHLIKEDVKELYARIYPKLRESEDERIKKGIIQTLDFACAHKLVDIDSVQEMKAYLEKQKDASYAIEAVERIDKYIDEHLANAHDMKDSNPDKKYYRGWDDALGKMAGILQDVYSGEKQKEQKPAEWSDEDKEMLQSCIDSVKYELLDNGMDDEVETDPRIIWLKSLPERFNLQQKQEQNDYITPHKEFFKFIYDRLINVHKENPNVDYMRSFKERLNNLSFGEKQEWSEEDEDALDMCLDAIPKKWKTKSGILLTKWLKDNIRYQFKPAEWSEDIIRKAVKEVGLTQHQIDWFKINVFPPKPEWSEEDEEISNNILNLICSQITYVTGQGTMSGKQYPTYTKERDWFMNRLKSLRAQWKPSKEQMDALEEVIVLLTNLRRNTGDRKNLESLYEQLKKLM